MALYRKLPDEIEAIQYTGSNFDDIINWVVANQEEEDRHVSSSQCSMNLLINFHGYDLHLKPGDYLYKTDDPEKYPYMFGMMYSDYFRKHYAPVEEEGEVTE